MEILEIFNLINFDKLIKTIETPILFNKISSRFIMNQEWYLGRPLSSTDNFCSKKSFLLNREKLSELYFRTDESFLLNIFYVYCYQIGLFTDSDQLDFHVSTKIFEVSFIQQDKNEYICFKLNEDSKNLLYQNSNFFKELCDIKNITIK